MPNVSLSGSMSIAYIKKDKTNVHATMWNILILKTFSVNWYCIVMLHNVTLNRQSTAYPTYSILSSLVKTNLLGIYLPWKFNSKSVVFMSNIEDIWNKICSNNFEVVWFRIVCKYIDVLPHVVMGISFYNCEKSSPFHFCSFYSFYYETSSVISKLTFSSPISMYFSLCEMAAVT